MLLAKYDFMAFEFQDRIQKPSLSPIVDLYSPQRLFGLAERIVAAESL